MLLIRLTAYPCHRVAPLWEIINVSSSIAVLKIELKNFEIYNYYNRVILILEDKLNEKVLCTVKEIIPENINNYNLMYHNGLLTQILTFVVLKSEHMIISKLIAARSLNENEVKYDIYSK